MGGNEAGFAKGVAANRPLYGMFTAVPPRYDLVNQAITWGMDRGWRLAAARECLKAAPKRVLDLCCGTGDLAFSLARLAENDIEINGLDYSEPMLELAAKKAEALPDGRGITFVHGDASSLPFPDGHFDCAGISFAFRNLTYKNPLAQKCLAEVLRVLQPGGRFVIVESSQPRNVLVRKLFHLYLRGYVYRIGWFISGNRGAYHYLAESAARFYSPLELQKLLLGAGFRQVAYRPLFLGAAGIYVAIK